MSDQTTIVPATGATTPPATPDPATAVAVTPTATPAPIVPLQMTLDAATDRMVSVLCQKNMKFSAHDVTRLLREAANMDALELAGCSKSIQVQIGPITKAVFDIEHPEVRDRVHALHSNGDMAGYSRTKKKSDRTGRDFWEYTPDQNPVAVASNLKALGN